MISKGGQQTLRNFAQERLLREMLSSSDTESTKHNKKPLGFLLVLDSYTSQIVNSVVQMKELLDAKIMGLEMINTKRKAFPNAQAIYFLEPTERNIELVAADVDRKLYDGLHLYFTRSIPDALFDILREHPEIVDKLISFKELNLDFLVVDDFQFTFNMRSVFNGLYAQRDTNGMLLKEIAEKLFTLVSVLIPTSHLEVISEKGTPADRVAQHLVGKFRSLQEKYPEVLAADARSVKLLVLDRSFDTKAPVFHDFFYAPMVHDLASVKNNKVKFATENAKGEAVERECELNETDECWTKYRFCHIADAERQNREGFDRFLKENGKTAKMQKGVTQNLTINDMKKMIKDLPQYTELLTRYSLHMHLIGQCLETFNVAGLKQIGDIEQTVATGVDSNCDQPSSSDIFASAIKVMGSPSVSPQNKLRLAMLIVSSMYLNDANLQKVKSLLSSQNDVRALDNLIYLGIRNDSSKGATKSRLTDDEKKYFKNYAKNAKYDLIRFTPRLQVILEQLQNNQLSTSQFSTQTISTGKAAASGKKLLSNDLLAFKNMGAPKSNSLTSKDKLIVFFVGGMSHSEVRVVKELESSGKAGDIIGICGGTSLLNPEAFIQELLDIGAQSIGNGPITPSDIRVFQ